MKEPVEVLASCLKELRERYSIKKIGVFGSCARGEHDDSSDIDILVEFERPTFDNYMDLKLYLEKLFGRPVDLVLRDTLKRRIREAVEREVKYAS